MFTNLCTISILKSHLPIKLSFTVETTVYFLVSPAYNERSMLWIEKALNKFLVN